MSAPPAAGKGSVPKDRKREAHDIGTSVDAPLATLTCEKNGDLKSTPVTQPVQESCVDQHEQMEHTDPLCKNNHEKVEQDQHKSAPKQHGPHHQARDEGNTGGQGVSPDEDGDKFYDCSDQPGSDDKEKGKVLDLYWNHNLVWHCKNGGTVKMVVCYIHT
jgi:hypothetical protein